MGGVGAEVFGSGTGLLADRTQTVDDRGFRASEFFGDLLDRKIFHAVGAEDGEDRRFANGFVGVHGFEDGEGPESGVFREFFFRYKSGEKFAWIFGRLQRPVFGQEDGGVQGKKAGFTGQRGTGIVNVIKLQLDVNHDGVMELALEELEVGG